MPIAGLTDQTRDARIGKLRLGVRMTKCSTCVKAGRGNTQEVYRSARGTGWVYHCSGCNGEVEVVDTYPKELTYFRYDGPDHLRSEFETLYGPEPTEVDVLFLSDDLERVFPQWLKHYGRNHALQFISDGEQVTKVDTGEVVPVEEAPELTPAANLKVVLYKLPTTSVFQVDTGSINSILNINGKIGPDGTLRKVLPNGSIVGWPLKLIRRRERIQHDGKMTTHWVLDLDIPVELGRLSELRPMKLLGSHLSEEERKNATDLLYGPADRTVGEEDIPETVEEPPDDVVSDVEEEVEEESPEDNNPRPPGVTGGTVLELIKHDAFTDEERDQLTAWMKNAPPRASLDKLADRLRQRIREHEFLQSELPF